MNIAVIFAGGIGTRMNMKALPKQFLKVEGKEIIVYTLEHYEKHSDIDAIIISCVAEWIDYLKDIVDKNHINKVKAIVAGGETGQESIYNGLAAAEKISVSDMDIVLVHDGVRPLIEGQTISDCLENVKIKGSAITVAPAIETIIRVDAQSTIKDVIKRSECWMARAPQCFYLRDLLGAHHMAQREKKYDFIDSAEMMRYYGYSLTTVMGPVENIKITTPMDFYTFCALRKAKENAEKDEL